MGAPGEFGLRQPAPFGQGPRCALCAAHPLHVFKRMADAGRGFRPDEQPWLFRPGSQPGRPEYRPDRRQFRRRAQHPAGKEGRISA